MKNMYLIMVLLIIACNQKKDKVDLSDLVQFDEKEGILIIKKEPKHLIKTIVMNSGKYNRQNLSIDTTNTVELIENVVSINGDSKYVNTWISFDNQSNFDHRQSYYYETSLGYENGKAFVDCFLPNFMYDKSKCYVLLNSFDNLFRSDQPSDTLWFDKDYLVRIPVKDYKIGWNNTKFVIVEEGIEKDKSKIKKTYVNKDFIVAKRSK